MSKIKDDHLITERVAGPCKGCRTHEGRQRHLTDAPKGLCDIYCEACCPVCHPKTEFRGGPAEITGEQESLFAPAARIGAYED